MIILRCINCDKEFKKRPQKHCSNKYCSSACYNKCKEGPKPFWDNATYEQIVDRLKFYFEKKVIRKDGCWDFKGSKNRGGYGLMSVNGVNRIASRISWIIHKGKIPEDQLVLHICDNPVCTNPEHLLLGSHKDNAVDRKIKSRNGNQFGEKNGSSKFTAEDILEIRKLCNDKVPYNEIVKKFGIAKPTISNIKKRKIWSHI